MVKSVGWVSFLDGQTIGLWNVLVSPYSDEPWTVSLDARQIKNDTKIYIAPHNNDLFRWTEWEQKI